MMMIAVHQPGHGDRQLIADDDRPAPNGCAITVAAVGMPAAPAGLAAADDPHAVVDQSCRVIGVDGLCVVADASVMPSVVSANTNLTTIMIGEKAADAILHG